MFLIGGEKDTDCAKKDTDCVIKDTDCVIFAFFIPYNRARVLELWNIEMLHQGREDNSEKRYLGCLKEKKNSRNPTKRTQKHERKTTKKKD